MWVISHYTATSRESEQSVQYFNILENTSLTFLMDIQGESNMMSTIMDLGSTRKYFRFKAFETNALCLLARGDMHVYANRSIPLWKYKLLTEQNSS